MPTTLCSEQTAAANALLERGGILRGRAGSGKSTVLRHMQCEADVSMCATTGRAALNVDGCTFDRMFAYSRDTGECWSTQFRDRQMAKAGDYIAVDEGSMSDRRMTAYGHYCANRYKKTLILVGDWAQAAPIGGDWAFDTEFFKNAQLIRLEQNHRQDEREFLDALEEIRFGGTDPTKIAPILSRCMAKPPEDARWTRLFGTNRDADNFNTNTTYALKSDHPEARMWAEYVQVSKTPKDPRQVERALMDSRMTHGEYFKVGCRVMVTKNIYEPGTDNIVFANGDTGTLEDLIFTAQSRPMPQQLAELANDVKLGMDLKPIAASIRLDRTDSVQVLYAQSDDMKDPDGSVYATIKGIPMTLGYAFTTHKMQGSTLQRVCIDAKSLLAMRESKHGLFYVGASRATTLAGLAVTNWTPDAVYCDPRVREFELGK